MARRRGRGAARAHHGADRSAPAAPRAPSRLPRDLTPRCWRRRAPQTSNDVSAHGALALGAGRRAQAVTLGFPFLGLRALFGVNKRVDLGWPSTRSTSS